MESELMQGAAASPPADAATRAARVALELARGQESRLAFLARASMSLVTSLDSRATAQHVARLAVPELADACIIDLAPTAGRTHHRAAVLHDALGTADLLARLLAAVPAAGSPQDLALRSGRAQAGAAARVGSLAWPSDTAENELIEAVAVQAWLVLPLRARGQTIGSATLLTTRQRGYAVDEFATAGEFIARASAALDNALLYESALQAHADAEAARVRAELVMEDLRASEDRYRTLFEESRDAIYITQRDGNFIDANTAALELFGCTRSELMRLNARDFYFDPADRDRFAGEIERHGSVRDFEIALVRRSGDRIECLLSAIARRAADDSITQYQGIIRDITRQKHAEQRLRDSEHFARTIVTSVQQGVIVFDRELRYQVWNRFMEEITGLKAAQVMGTQALDAFPELRQHGIEALLARALTGETVHAPDMPFVIAETRSAGWVTAVYSPHVSPDGEIIGVVAIVHDITERKRAEDQLLHNAFHDVLTDLPNRALFVDRLEQMLRKADRHPEYTFGVAFLDVDRFKSINDTLGHLVGDELLVSIARRLEACVRTGDTVARIGGDEFAVLLDDVRDVTDATHVAERILVELGGAFHLAGQEVFTSASIGIALSSSGYDRPEDIVSDADTAMYRAKLEGRSRYEVFDRELHQRALDSAQNETDLRRALERSELELHYQPIIGLGDGRIKGFEALIRWNHPRLGVLPPDQFIPTAEATSLIVDIGWWVLARAATQMHEWLRRFPERTDLFVTVNLSPRQFHELDVVERITGILSSIPLPPSALKLEITEALVVQNDSRVMAALTALRDKGIRLCIDDFGTGSSALSFLHTFPVDTLKIDRTFVSQIGFAGSSVRLVETILAVGQNLGLDAIAEGVETNEQLELLRQLGPEFAQGFLFSAARTPVEIETLLRRNPAW